MRVRVQDLGERNIIGKQVEKRRKELKFKQCDVIAQLQLIGVDINSSSYSKLEGQIRKVSDIEIKALAEILDTTPNELLGW